MTSTAANRFGRIAVILVGMMGVLFSSTARAADDKRNRWNKDWGPLVPHKTFPKDCGLCHMPKTWDVLRPDFQFDHFKETGYRLEGAHARAACLRCHNDRGPVKAYASRGCAGCHADPHRSQMGLDCKRCHNQEDWLPSNAIAQHAQTPFPLTGMHAALQCEQCHTRAAAGDYKGAPLTCVGCHQSNFSTAPNHVAMNFSSNCLNCHTTVTWTSARFDHSSLGPNPVCYSCHQADYQRAPNHVAMNFPTTCGQCHTTVTWTGATFNHAVLGPNPNCYACHQADYQRAPNHVAMSFPTTCAQCHTTVSWTGATFTHTFPLTGPHNVSCTICHPGGSTTTFTCLVCHLQAQTDSNHTSVAGYSYNSLACYRCHPTGQKP